MVSQLGAREHYAVARALHRDGRLARLYTDFWWPASWGKVSVGAPRPLRALSARRHDEIPDSIVRDFPVGALTHRVQGLLRGAGGRGGRRDFIYEQLLIQGREFSQAVAAHLRRSAPSGVFFAYTTGALESLEAAKDAGMRTAVDQIDPGRVEAALVKEERQRWPGWEEDEAEIPSAYWDRLQAEWDRADRVVVNSEWSRVALVQQGVPAEKLVVLPLAFEPPAVPEVPRDYRGRLNVLWLGTLILRKGIQYLLAAAERLLSNPRIHFTLAGPSGLQPDRLRSLPSNVEYVGPVTRDGVTALYQKAHLFVLPTVSDGFAITQLEALSHGLPIVVTPNCARVLTDDRAGRVIPPQDEVALAQALDELAEDPHRLEAMSAAARTVASGYSLEHLRVQLQQGWMR